MTSVLRLAFCAAVLAVSSAWAQSYDSLESTGVRFATGATSSTKVERMRITQGGLVGIDTQSPTAALQVSGTFAVSNSAQGATIPSLVVNSSGNRGVGINPGGTYRLHVSGSTRIENNNSAGTTSLASLWRLRRLRH